MKIEILGMGCPKCLKLEENAKKALAGDGVTAEITKVTDLEKILSYGVAMTPALVINGEVKCAGKIASVEEITKWVHEV